MNYFAGTVKPAAATAEVANTPNIGRRIQNERKFMAQKNILKSFLVSFIFFFVALL